MSDATCRRCRVCGETKPLAHFYLLRNANGRRYPCSYCKPCAIKKRRQYDQCPQFPETIRRRHLKRFGLTPADFDAMLVAQTGVCAICGKAETHGNHKKTGIRRLSVDHCHASGKVRSLLCASCNKGLGAFFDSSDLLRKAADYLDRHAQT